MRNVFALGLMFMVSLTAHAYVITPYTAEYKIYAHGIHVGDIHQDLKQHDDIYVLSNSAQSTGVAALIKDRRVDERSSFHFNDEVIVPLSYSYKESDRDKRNVSLDFNWPAKELASNKQKKLFTLPDGVEIFDKLSYQVALMRDLSMGLTKFTYTAHDGKGYRDYELLVIEDEVLSVHGKKLNTKKVRLKRENSSRETTLWLAPEMDYIPVKLTHTERKGRVLTATLSNYKLK